jgi:signal transduction histidine kinase
VWETGQTLAVEDYGRWAGGRPEYAHLRAVVGTPLFVRGQVIGVIGVVTQQEGRHFTEDEQELLSRYGQMASLALHHARLLDAAQNEVAERIESERVLAESLQREHHAAEELRRVNEMKNAFLTAVSHELRTPLTSVVGFSDTLQKWNTTLTSDERMVMLDRLSRNARKLDRLLTDLLDVDRLTRGILKPSLKNTDVGGLVRAVVENAEFLEGRPVHVSAPSMVLKVDGPKVERIVENLLANAVRYTSERTDIWVKLTRVPEGVLLVVEDAGNGIPPSVQESIFEPFQQGPEKIEHSPGVGIGLSLVFRFAEMHRGRAWVEERPGGGASFRVLLPEPTATLASPGRVRVSR